MNAVRQLLSVEDRIFSQLQRLKALAATDPRLVPIHADLVGAWARLREEAQVRARVIEDQKAAVRSEVVA